MKKFMKISLITAGILAAVGFVFCLIGGLAGGMNLIISMKNDAYMEGRLNAARRVVEALDNGLSTSKTGSEGHHGTDSQSTGNQSSNQSASNQSNNNQSTKDQNTGSDKLTVNGSEADGGIREYHVEIEDLRDLNLYLGAGTFIISEKDETDGLIDLYINGEGKVDYFIKDKALYVEGFKGNHLIGISELDNSITLRIPKGMGFDEVELEIGAGIMDIENLKAREFDATVGAGELTIYNSEVTDFSAEIGAGNFTAGGMHVWEADFEVSLGSCSYEGIIEGELDAECDMGNMEFLIKGKEEEHNYEIECSAGNIYLDGYEFSGLAAEKYVNHGAASTYELTCNMGSITLEFQG